MRSRTFYKLSGSGNDFVFFDARHERQADLEEAAAVRALCARGTGVGADGVVFLEPSARADVGVRYLNADGSLAALCGNATLCAARLAVELGAVAASGFVLETGSGLVAARVRNGLPEIDLAAPECMNEAFGGIPLQRGELRAGFGVTGVPHLVILCEDVERPDVVRRGAALRYDSAFAEGTNVNWIAAVDSERSEWRYRTYERGVEDETLACGTGAVTCAALLRAWGLSGVETRLRTRSGKVQTVRLECGDGVARASLAGEARIVFEGTLRELD